MYLEKLKTMRQALAVNASSIDYAPFKESMLGMVDELVADREVEVDIASRDEDTMLRNADYFAARLEGEWDAAMGGASPLSLIRVSADGKLDAIGRGMLDAAADFAGTSCRTDESEFAIILPETDERMAADVVYRTGAILADLQTEKLVNSYAVGVATLVPRVDRTIDELREAAVPVPLVEPPIPRGLRFSGCILDVTPIAVVQDVGRGNYAEHPRSALDVVPRPGDDVRISYDRDGHGHVESIDRGNAPEISR